MSAALGFFTLLGIGFGAIVLIGAFESLSSRGGTWWLVTRTGLRFGPFKTRSAAENYPNTFMGTVADAPAFRLGWHVEEDARD